MYCLVEILQAGAVKGLMLYHLSFIVSATPKALAMNTFKHIKGSTECYLLGQKCSLQIWGVIPLGKLQNNRLINSILLNLLYIWILF